jgi:23S rRNA pseudouridine2605 synthase/23S rRNA pseudouridine2604 synthase
MVLQEGKNRQIRRMVRKVGNEVTRLQRKRFAGIKLGNLASGKWRYLTPAEMKRLMNSL